MSRADETMMRVSYILNQGMLQQVDRKQVDTREFLVDVEERLNQLIADYHADIEEYRTMELPESAAVIHGENINQELVSAISAINNLSDNQLRFQLTVFIDDYRRILSQNREAEKTQVLEELDKHFKDEGEFVMPLQPVKTETDAMKQGMKVVEEEAKKLAQLHKTTIRYLEYLRKENKKESKKPKSQPQAILRNLPEKGNNGLSCKFLRDLICKPAVRAGMDPSEYTLAMSHIANIEDDSRSENASMTDVSPVSAKPKRAKKGKKKE